MTPGILQAWLASVEENNDNMRKHLENMRNRETGAPLREYENAAFCALVDAVDQFMAAYVNYDEWTDILQERFNEAVQAYKSKPITTETNRALSEECEHIFREVVGPNVPVRCRITGFPGVITVQVKSPNYTEVFQVLLN